MRSYRLDLSLEHAAILRQWAGCARLVWNLALEQRMAAWEFNKHRTDDRRWKDQPCPNYVRQCQEVSALRAEHPWLAAAPAQVLQQKLRDLDTAFQRLFLGLAEHPVRKRKGHSTDSLRFPQADNRGWRRLSKHVGALRLPKLGWVRFRWSRQVVDIRLGERLRNVTLIHKPDGWHAVFCVELPAGAPPVPNSKPAGGVDRGCAVAVATSDGELLDVQPLTQCERQRYKRLQRKAARQQRGSHRWRRMQHQLALLAHRATLRRQEFAYQTAHRLAAAHGVVVLEKLHVKAMTRSARGTRDQPGTRVKQKSGLNRAILDKGWGALQRRLEVVCPAAGSELRLVPAKGTSIRCRVCGHTNPSNRESQAVFRCRCCGWVEHADLHAAKNIKYLGTVGWRAPSQSGSHRIAGDAMGAQSAPADGRAAAGRGGSRLAKRLRPFRRSGAEASTHRVHAQA